MFFIHYNEGGVFERFGGIYIPFATEEEARNQAAWDLADESVEERLEGIFEADYGGHHRVDNADEIVRSVVGSVVDLNDYDKPFGHLDPDRRRKVATMKQCRSEGKRRRQNQIIAQHEAVVDHILGLHRGKIADSELDEVHRLFKKVGDSLQGAVPGNAYTVLSGGTATGGAIALTAATAKTVLMLIASTANQPSWVEAQVSFDGVSASAVPVLVEWISSTQATAGTNTAQTPKQIRGWPGQPSQTSAAVNYTAEGTTYEAFKKRLLTPNGGLLVIQQPMGREPTGIITATTQFKGMGFRLTAPAGVNCHVDAEFEE